MKIILYEFRKLIYSKRSLIIIAAVLMQILLILVPRNFEHEYSDEIYINYMKQLEGEYTEEKRNIILNRYYEINQTINEHENMITAYKQNTILLDEFEAHNSDFNRALAELSTIEYLMQKCSYFDEIGEGVFFYDTPWIDFFTNSGFNYIVALTIICLIIPVFDSEYQSEAAAMLLTSKYGKNYVCISKLIMVIVLAFAVALALYIVQYVTFVLHIKADHSDLDIKNLMGYKAFSGDSLKQYYMNDAVIKSFSCAAAALFICAVSIFAKNTVFTFFISFVFIVCPYFISSFFRGSWFEYAFAANQLGAMYSEDLNIMLYLSHIY
jgi:ABC-type transport system involved in multi-copper enzyme maturation permease subunit